jgi:glutathione synthase/RimK-type ligase-like ATP-grasp enzyme
MRLAVVSCDDLWVDPDTPLLLAALEAKASTVDLVSWRDAERNWDHYDLAVVRSTWDYATQRADFCAWADRVPRLMNPAPVLRWNTDKHYLADLVARGVATIPTTFVDVGDRARFPDGEFVVKPAVGAGSMGADRFGPGDLARAHAHVAALHAEGRDVLVQPYVSTIDAEGELALVFVGGRLLHAMRKGAMLRTSALDRSALFRAEQMQITEAPADALTVAHGVLEAARAAHLLYARVDLVRFEGRWVLMELELTEPSLFLSFREGLADVVADHIVACARR